MNVYVTTTVFLLGILIMIFNILTFHVYASTYELYHIFIHIKNVKIVVVVDL